MAQLPVKNICFVATNTAGNVLRSVVTHFVDISIKYSACDTHTFQTYLWFTETLTANIYSVDLHYITLWNLICCRIKFNKPSQ